MANHQCACGLCGRLRTLDTDGSLSLEIAVPCTFCGAMTQKAWPSWGGFVAACDRSHANQADDALALELERGGL